LKHRTAAKRESGRSPRYDHPWAPLVEIEIVRTPRCRIIGFPNAALLRRPLVPALELDATRQMSAVLDGSSGWKAKLLDYVSTYDQFDDSGADNDKLATALAKLIRCGRIGARTQPGAISGPQTMTISERDTLAPSSDGERFLYNRETVPGHPELSDHLYWPKGESGVTIGPGYDMRKRRKEVIAADLQGIGINPQLADLASDGAQLDHVDADTFAKKWETLLKLSEDQQLRLMRYVVPQYVNFANEGINAPVRMRLFGYEFDALVSFTYNVGNLAHTNVATLLNNGDVVGSIQAMAHYRTADPNRRGREMALYGKALY
jgi:GH24 family phage-related lysozyme (muramidase)